MSVKPKILNALCKIDPYAVCACAGRVVWVVSMLIRYCAYGGFNIYGMVHAIAEQNIWTFFAN